MNKSLSFVFLSICLLSTAVDASNNKPDELQVGPVNLTQDVNGVSVVSIVTSFFKLQTNESGLFLKARIVSDLSDLQRKIGQIIDTFPLPSDNCRSYSGNNPVVIIPRKELTFVDKAAVLNIGGSVVMWDCRENPVPNSKVEWKTETVASFFGKKVKTKVPKVITWPGSPIKNKLGSQSFDVSLPIIAYAPNPQTAEIKFGNPRINLKGQYAFITKGILNIAGIDINSEAKKALTKAIDPASLQQAIPEEYAQLNPVVERLEFLESSGSLNIAIELSAAVPAEKITAFVQLLLKK